MEKSNKSIKGHVPDFLDYCEVEKGLSDNTQKNYHNYLKKFIFWLRKTDKENIRPHELTKDDIWNYRLFLSRHVTYRGKPLKKVTQNYYLIALRALLRYFSDRDIESLPADKIKLPKDAKTGKTVKFLNLDQIEKLLLAPDVSTRTGVRNRAILETLFSTGLRVSELVALDREQFASIKDKKDFELGIVGKGGRPRTVYFSERALSWVKRYIESREDDKKPLFVNYRGRNPLTRLTRRSVERIVKKAAIKAGVPLFTSPHTLRHSMATDLLTQGVDLRAIQEFLGHKNIATTQVYTHVTNKRLKDIHRKYHSGKELKE
ncbi:MAG: tyrosine-type recombinase/integrase [Candidatus Nealsonbacteria bacterium]|nr:tyrosine-type recombinase/integrase [Candidatus Nealsonbacteria bacterium]